METKKILNSIKNEYNVIIHGNYEEQCIKGFLPRIKEKTIKIDLPIKWTHKDSNIAFTLQKWQFMCAMWNAFFEKNEKKILLKIYSYIKDWHDQCLNSSIKFSWYDMAVGVRSIHLALFFQIYKTNIFTFNDEQKKIIEILITKHLEKLKNPLFLSKGNHGVWQIYGLLRLSNALNDKQGYLYGIQCIKDFINTCFTEEFVCKEGSPFYHGYNISLFSYFLYFQKEFDKLNTIIKEGAIINQWLTAPNGLYYPIGDTEGFGKKLTTQNIINSKVFNSNGVQFIIKDLSKSGYIISRTTPDVQEHLSESFVFSSANISNLHGHSDDLGFIFITKGITIFSDPGKYTYEKNYWREYFSGDISHNVIGIENTNFLSNEINREDTGLSNIEIFDNHIFMKGKVKKSNLLYHKRNIQYFPGTKIIIEDIIENNSTNNTELRFIFDPDIQLCQIHKNECLIIKNEYLYGKIYLDDSLDSLKFYFSQIIKVNESVFPRGWYSNAYNKLQPAYALYVTYNKLLKNIKTLIEIEKTPKPYKIVNKPYLHGGIKHPIKVNIVREKNNFFLTLLSSESNILFSFKMYDNNKLIISTKYSNNKSKKLSYTILNSNIVKIVVNTKDRTGYEESSFYIFYF